MANAPVSDTNRLGTPRVDSLPVGAGTPVFSKNEILISIATGLSIPAAGTNYAPVSDITRIAGRAVDNSVNPITQLPFTSVEIETAEPGTRFCLPLYHTTASSAVITYANIGKAYEIRRSTAVNGISFTQVDLTSTADGTNACFRILGLRGDDAPGWPDSLAGQTPFALVYGEFVASKCQLTGGR